MVPTTNSGETARDAEPNIGGDPTNPHLLVGSAFTPDPNGSLSGVLYFSTDAGQTWYLTPAFVPASAQLTCITTYCDISLRFGGTSGMLYLGFLTVDNGGITDLSVGRASSIATNARTFTALETRNGAPGAYPDQPWVQAATVLEGAGQGNDRVLVTNNDGTQTNRTATADVSLNAVPPPPSGFGADVVEAVTTCGRDLPSVRPTVHLDGTVYVAFYRATANCGTSNITADVVVVRDDNWGTGPNPFQSLHDVNNNTIGQRVAIGVNAPFLQLLGNQRVGSQIAAAVDPTDSRTVYVAWGDGNSGASQTLHVRRSTDAGQTWSGDLRTINTATNAGLAINSHGKVAFLYQQLGNPGTGNRWRTHLERTTNAFTTVADLALADVPDQMGSYTGRNPIGDYDNVTALGKDFYGTFSAFNTADQANFPNGVTYLRYADFMQHKLYADAGHTMLVAESVDPFSFHVTELASDQDFYVRDWTNSLADHDNGQEPSTNTVFWYSSDAWNRAGNAPGAPNPSGWFPTDNMQAGVGTKGDNFAFVRVHRNATGSAAQVTAHFLVSPFGTGSNFQDAAVTADPVLNFAANDAEQTLSTGYQWHQDPTNSTHACLAVQISTPNDPYTPPGLLGTTPGWPSGVAIVEDNNKAQRNLDVSNNLADFSDIAFALVHNAALVPRDIVLRFDSPSPERLRGAELEIVGGRRQAFRSGDTLSLEHVEPGENRWIGLRLTVGKGDPLPINFYELDRGRVVNGFTMLIEPVSLSAAIKHNLRDHGQVFGRLAAAFDVRAARGEALAAEGLLRHRAVSRAQYLGFLRGHSKAIQTVLDELMARERAQDAFQARRTLEGLRSAAVNGDADSAASHHAILLHQLDGFATMLRKAHGDPADIPQMVRWQEELYSSRQTLRRLGCANYLVKESQEFIRALSQRRKTSDSYPELLRELGRCFRETAEALDSERIKRAAGEIERAMHSLPALEKEHRDYLRALQDAAR